MSIWRWQTLGMLPRDPREPFMYRFLWTFYRFAQHLKLGELNQQLKGSPLYMAPEIVRKHQYDAKADLWSVGVILYECLFGKAPYSSRTIEELLLRIRKAEPIVLPPNARISNECHDLLRRLLAHEPAQRISFADFFAHPFLDLKTFPSEQTLKKAIDLVTQAVGHDEKRNYKEAYYLYCSALQYFVPLITEESDASRRQELRNRALTYMKRAEEIKNVIIEDEYKLLAQRQQKAFEMGVAATTAEAANQQTQPSTSRMMEMLEPDARYKQLCTTFHLILIPVTAFAFSIIDQAKLVLGKTFDICEPI